MHAVINLIAAFAALAAPPSLPEKWNGSWSGTCEYGPAAGKRSTVAMRLDVSPLSGRPGSTWRLTYGEGEKKDVRSYELLPELEAGRFVVDEKNGIILDNQLVDDTLESLFNVGGKLISARFRHQGNEIQVEMMTFEAKTPRVNKVDKVGDVLSYRLTSIQKGTLKRSAG